MIKQALENKGIERFYHYYKYATVAEISWNLRLGFGIIKHLLNPLPPTSLVLAKQI